MFKELPEVLGETSFLGLLLAGAAVVVLGPTLKNVVRGVAVGTAKGVLSLAEGGQAFASNLKEGWEDVVAEAQAQKGMHPANTGITLGAGAGGALGATVGGMAGPVGAAVGGGLGGAVGASVGSQMQEKSTQNNHSE